MSLENLSKAATVLPHPLKRHTSDKLFYGFVAVSFMVFSSS
jgi:hypothetical protein